MRKQELHPRTEVLNKTQKNQSQLARYEALRWLATTFPQVFDNSLRIRPLKIGIMKDILAYADQVADLPLSKSKLREAVVLFTRRIDYLTCLKAREERIDLEGKAVSVVTEEEAEKASTKIRKRVDKNARNARKNLANKNTASYPSRSASNQTPQVLPSDNFPQYPERAPAFSTQKASVSTPRPSVVVTHKIPRQFDPIAVARLKEKLGIYRKAEENEKDAVE